jgi:hypothetical protein
MLFSYKVDSEAWSEYSSQTSVTLGTETSLSDGSHTFSVKAKDQAGNEDQSPAVRTFKVDATEPELSLPADIIQEATGESGAKVTYIVTASDEVDGSVNVSCIPASDTTFGLGTTQVNCSATDKAGNEATGSFDVTVQDTTSPQTEITEGPNGTISDNSHHTWTHSTACHRSVVLGTPPL